MDFPHEVRFFAGIGPAHFPAETTGPLGRGCLPFSPSFIESICTCYYPYLFSICRNVRCKDTIFLEKLAKKGIKNDENLLNLRNW
jgi:hypothetical protein